MEGFMLNPYLRHQILEIDVHDVSNHISEPVLYHENYVISIALYKGALIGELTEKTVPPQDSTGKAKEHPLWTTRRRYDHN